MMSMPVHELLRGGSIVKDIAFTGIFKYAGGARRRFLLMGEIYLLQRRPAHTDVILNHKSQGIRVLDPWNGTDLCRVDFTKGYDSSGPPNGWCLRDDGKAVLLLHQESQRASLLSLTAPSASYDLKAPPLPEMSDLRYDTSGKTAHFG
jgi:hypothetical protein